VTQPATIHIDGAARGNPGPAAYAYVIERDGHPVVEHSEAIGKATNNVAEYTALLRALEKAAQLALRRLVVFSDSELLVKQISGEYRVKHPDLQSLFAYAEQLIDRFDSVKLRHVRREQNKRADELCNIALDALSGQTSTPHGPPKSNTKAPKPAEKTSDASVRGDCVACLQSAAQEWAAAGTTDKLHPEQVWEQLWSILEDGGVLRKRSAK
jgi:ribonuclease HI